MASGTPSTEEVIRARTGCLVCRSRKVRCDRTLPSCQNCMRLGVSCPGFDEGHQAVSRKQMSKSTDDIFKAAGKERRRMGSCEHCRSSKSLCSRDRPTCKRCSLRSLDCVYRGKLDKASPVEPSETRSEINFLQRALSHRTIVVPALEIDYEQLCSETLPDDAALRNHLINIFFERVHPLRCLGFIHKPSFMQAMDRASMMQDYIEPLVYAICALGARGLYLDSIWTRALDHIPGSVTPGEGWAGKAHKEVLLEAHAPTLQHLMAMILLCEYGLRTDKNAQVFVLSGCLFRSLRLLGLDMPQQLSLGSESSSEILQRETENRVVWACYHIDLLLASGVDKNSLWREDFPLIPLPCSNENFLSSSHTNPRYLSEVGSPDNMVLIRQFDLPSLVTVSLRLRSTVLRLIRTTPAPDTIVWDPTSPFLMMLNRLENFHANLPERFGITDINMYMHRDQNLIGAVLLLHLVYHAAVFDFTRITLPGFTFPLSAAFRDAPDDFRFKYQQHCRYHAKTVSSFFRQAFAHGMKALDQPILADIALESAKIQIIYAATVDNSAESIEMARQNVLTNLQVLKMLHAGEEGQSLYTLRPFGRLPGMEQASSPSEVAAEVTGSADIHHLSNMAFFRKARSEVRAGHAGSSRSALSSSGLGASPNTIAMDREGQQTTGHNAAMGMSMNDHVAQHSLFSGTTTISPHVLDTASRQPAIHSHNADMENMQSSMEHYIRTADGINNFLTYHMSEMSEHPLGSISTYPTIQIEELWTQYQNVS